MNRVYSVCTEKCFIGLYRNVFTHSPHSIVARSLNLTQILSWVDLLCRYNSIISICIDYFPSGETNRTYNLRL